MALIPSVVPRSCPCGLLCFTTDLRQNRSSAGREQLAGHALLGLEGLRQKGRGTSR